MSLPSKEELHWAHISKRLTEENKRLIERVKELEKWFYEACDKEWNTILAERDRLKEENESLKLQLNQSPLKRV